MTKIKPGCWVMVVWHDAADEKQTCMRDEEIDEAVVEVISVGYLVRRTPLYWTIAGDRHMAGEEAVYGRVTRIPRPMVQKVTELK